MREGKEGEFIYPLNGKGHKFRTDDMKRKEIIHLHDTGVSFRDLAIRFGLCKATIYAMCHADRNEVCPQKQEGWIKQEEKMIAG